MGLASASSLQFLEGLTSLKMVGGGVGTTMLFWVGEGDGDKRDWLLWGPREKLTCGLGNAISLFVD